MRYLTLWALKMDKSSLKSGYIRGRALHRVSGKGDFGNRVHPLMHGPTLPVPIFVGLHFIEAVIDTYRLVHAFPCSTAPLLLATDIRPFQPLSRSIPNLYFR